MGTFTSETAAKLGKETITKLQQLAQINVDSAKGFQEAADAVSDKSLTADFRVWASDRTRQADELSGYVELNDERTSDKESWAAALHQSWLQLRAALSSDDAYAVLAEAERGESLIQQKYEEVLEETRGSAIEGVLQRQYADVKAVHERIRSLRDARKT